MCIRPRAIVMRKRESKQRDSLVISPMTQFAGRLRAMSTIPTDARRIVESTSLRADVALVDIGA
jgi:hypothetical protein